MENMMTGMMETFKMTPNNVLYESIMMTNSDEGSYIKTGMEV
jgi:hypothetical protein